MSLDVAHHRHTECCSRRLVSSVDATRRLFMNPVYRRYSGTQYGEPIHAVSQSYHYHFHFNIIMFAYIIVQIHTQTLVGYVMENYNTTGVYYCSVVVVILCYYDRTCKRVQQ